jgi:hypothetical protein
MNTISCLPLRRNASLLMSAFHPLPTLAGMAAFDPLQTFGGAGTIVVMSWSLAFLALALAFGGALAWGLKSGSMPAEPNAVARAEHPLLYWIWAAILGAFTVGALVAALHQGRLGL